MKTIKLTNASDGVELRIVPDHVVAYWWQEEHLVSEVVMSNNGFDISLKVKETAEEIDKLLLELP